MGDNSKSDNKEVAMKRLYFALVFAVVTTGCAFGPIGKLPMIVDEKLTGEVTVIRKSDFVGCAVNYIITLNGKEIFGIRSGQYTKFKLNEGEYHIGIKSVGNINKKEDPCLFTVTPNSNTYFLARPTFDFAVIYPISEAAAQKRIQKSKYFSMEQQ